MSTIELDQGGKTNNKSKGRFVAGVLGGLGAGILAICLPFVTPAFRRVALPFLPATDSQIRNVIRAVKHQRPNDKTELSIDLIKVIDLGSGDGRIVIQCAKHGIQAEGVELNLWLVLYSKYRAFMEGVHHRTSFKRKNLFKIDFAEYDKIIVFGVDSLMPMIKNKIRRDCDQAQRPLTLIACRFPIIDWQPYKIFGEEQGTSLNRVWVYKYYPSMTPNTSN